MRRKNKNIILEKLLVEDYAAEGKSLARVDGKVIFVENLVPGDVADVRLLKNKKDWAEGVALRIHSFSAQRVEPFCSHFGVCGGCQWQMLPYEKQLQYKNRQVKETLQRIGKTVLPEMLPIIGATEDTLYRNKMEYSFSAKKFIPDEEFRELVKLGEDVKTIAQKNVHACFHCARWRCVCFFSYVYALLLFEVVYDKL